MNYIYGSVVRLMICYSLITTACVKQQKLASTSPKVEHSIEFDTVQKNNIEAIVNKINEEIKMKGVPGKILFPLYNAQDSIKYWTVDGELARISAVLSFPDRVIGPTFLLQDDELILIRYRLWSLPEPSYAEETITYLQKGKIVYCNDRRIDLPTGEMPAMLRKKEFMVCTKSLQEIEKDPKEYWKTIKEFLDIQLSTND